MSLQIVPATEEHARAIAANPRVADEREVRASCGLSVGWALRYGIRHSTHAWTAIIHGKPVCMFGLTLTSAITGSGSVWCLGSADMDIPAVRRVFVEWAPKVLADVQARYRGTLFNYVDVRNNAAIRWLKWMGFTLMAPRKFGRNGELFMPFYIQGAAGPAGVGR